MYAQQNPKQKPISTCDRLCWRNIILLVPTIPPRINTRHSHHIGLKEKICENASNAPVTPPMAAEWVETFHQIFMNAHSICMTKAVTRMMVIYRGTFL